jgi:hypothetical protein
MYNAIYGQRRKAPSQNDKIDLSGGTREVEMNIQNNKKEQHRLLIVNVKSVHRTLTHK